MTHLRFASQNTDALKQAVRWRRFMFAGAFSVLYLLVLVVYHLEGSVDRQTLATASVIVGLLILLFMVVFWSGLNLKFMDPGLTQWQMLAAVFTMLYVVYRAPDTRLAFNAFFFVALMFGLLRRSGRTLAMVGVVSLLAYALVISLRYVEGQDADVLRLDMLQFMVMSVTLPWFLFIGEHVKRLRRGLAEANVKLEDIAEIARYDDLTKVYSRRSLLAAMEEAKRRADAVGDPLSICVVDLDHFKRFNDEMDHLTGDQVLRTFAQAAQSTLRANDVFGRYGGEEFVQVLSHTTLAGAAREAERLRLRVSQVDLKNARRLGPLTVSVGVAQYQPGETIAATFARADAALHRAKQAGRDRVERE